MINRSVQSGMALVSGWDWRTVWSGRGAGMVLPLDGARVGVRWLLPCLGC